MGSFYTSKENRENKEPTSHSQALLVLKETREQLERLEPRDHRVPKEKKGQDGAATTGVKYVRWGRTTCPSGAQIVYKGKRKGADMIVTITPMVLKTERVITCAKRSLHDSYYYAIIYRKSDKLRIFMTLILNYI